MGFVPADAEWYLAELVQELTVEQELTVQEDSRNVVWRNLTLVHAHSPDEAYEKALSLGRAGDTEYVNPSGKLVTTRFQGLSFIDVIHEKMGPSSPFTRKTTSHPSDSGSYCTQRKSWNYSVQTNLLKART
jgi:Domain of unknown function (DUF4288)